MSAKHVIALLNSHVHGDDEQFLSIALQVAAQEARQGRTADADKLKQLVQAARTRGRDSASASGQTPIPLARARGELQTIVESTYPKLRLDSMVLDGAVRTQLNKLVRQQQHRASLREHNHCPTSRLLLVGPPGTGKTMTASALAGELHLPLFRVRIDALFSRYLGETASKLRLVFDQIAQTRGVYLFDEFDAVGASRAEANDIGEVRRVLNSVLVFLEEPNSSDSLVLCATNHVELLDEALARRFEEVIEYGLPAAAAANTILGRRLGRFKPAKMTNLGPATEGLSQGELARAADSVVKDAILDGAKKVALPALRHALENRQSLQSKFRRTKR